MRRPQLNQFFSGALIAVSLVVFMFAAAGCEQAGVGAEIPPTATTQPPATTEVAAPTPTVVGYAGGGLVTPTPGYSTPVPISSPVPTDVPDPAHTPTPVPNPVAVPSPTATSVAAPTQPAPTPVPPATATPTPEPTATPTIGPPTPTPITPLSRTTQFVPLDNPVFVPAANAPSRVTDESFVLGLERNGEVHAYPLDMMWWHHIVNDTIGGDPVLVTY